jgi:hypothetical protein
MIDDFLAALPAHKCSLHLTHNEHLSYYSTVEEEDRNGHWNWVSEAQRQLAIQRNEMWQIQWYPETPVGFHSLCAAELGALLEAVREHQ